MIMRNIKQGLYDFADNVGSRQNCGVKPSQGNLKRYTGVEAKKKKKCCS